ncbi:MAG: PH domain-containing protein [Thermoanaerobaculia bacterium]|nr:PH domain-containing protein [Thermoanaerobaculia bacterium]
MAKARTDPQESLEFRPSTTIKVAVGVSTPFFLGLLGLAFFLPLKPLYQLVAVLFVVVAALAVTEIMIERVRVTADGVEIRRLFKREVIGFAEIERVSMEGGGIALLLRTGGWKKLPGWLGANTSARHWIADGIKRARESA